MRLRILGIFLTVTLFPGIAFAYVDPGILSILYQFLYVAGFGALGLFIFKPWRLVRSWLKRPATEHIASEGAPPAGEQDDSKRP